MWGLPKTARATRIARDLSYGSWPMAVEAVDEEDGGTFYRPDPPTWHSGSGAPSATLGDEGDYYMDLSAEPPEWYGPKGEEDEEGAGDWGSPTALADPGAAEWITGSGEPDDADDGNDGDFFLDTGAMAWWGPKAGASWTDTGPNYIRASWIEFDTPRPRTSGLFQLPANIIGVGDSDEPEPQDADAWLELADVNGKRLQRIHTASLSASGGIAIGGDSTDPLAKLLGNKEIFKARWIIVGGRHLTWSGSGSLVQLA